MSASLRRSLLVGIAVAGIGAVLPAFAGSDHGLGDGSDTNNPDLLRHGSERNSDSCLDVCEFILPDGRDANLREPYDPFFDIDWSLSLRGAYVHTTTGERYEGIFAPSVSLSHEGNRAKLAVDADAEVVKSLSSELRVAAINLSGTYDYALDRLTTLSVGARLNLSQSNPDEPLDLSDPEGLVSAPLTISGGVDGSLTRQFGLVDLALRGSLGRTVYGPTTYVAPPIVDNNGDNFTEAAGGLRLSVELTPVLTGFVDGNIAHSWFDAPSAALTTKTDATTYTGKVGVSADWRQVVEAELSVGLALRRFDDESLAEVVGTLYDASVTWRPDTTWALRAAFSTNIAPPGPEGDGTARIEYGVDADIGYIVNSWLALRASAAWYATDVADAATDENGYSFGFGADYQFNEHTRFSADYAFTHDTVAGSPDEDGQRVTVGVTFTR